MVDGNNNSLEGMQLAVKEINQRGFLSVPLRLVTGGCTQNSAFELALSNGVRVIVNACNEDVSAPAAQQNNIAMLNLYDKKAFSMMPSHELMDAATAKSLFNERYKKLGVLHSRDIQLFVHEFEQLGGITLAEYVEPNSSATPQLTRLRANVPDALFIVDVNVNNLEHFSQVFSYVNIENVTVLQPAIEIFFTEYFQRVYDKQPSYDAALGYDAIKIIAEALREAPYTGAGIRDALFQVSFDGATGHVDFDENGIRVGNVSVVMQQKKAQDSQDK